MIEEYPEFSPLSVEQRSILHPCFQRLAEGMSELTFAGIYLFRAAHDYRVSCAGEGIFVIAGRDGEPFFILPFHLPSEEILDSLFDRYHMMKAVSASQAEQLSRRGYRVWEDRAKRRAILAYASQWDSPEAAREYFEAYRQILGKKWKNLEAAPAGPDFLAGRGDDGYFLLQLTGAMVTSLEGAEKPLR